jgi:hypothetical protein
VRGWWDAGTKTVECEACHGVGEPLVIDVGVAGGSARREYARRVARDQEKTLEQHPRIGKRLVAVRSEPQQTAAWAQGAVGEERVGDRLDRLTKHGAIVLHDRRVPRSRANIDHIVVARSGVWVIDTKRYRGKHVEPRDVGRMFRSDVRLFVEGRDRTRLVDAMLKQVAVVRDVVGGAVRVRGYLCFVEAEWATFTKPFAVRGIGVTWPTALVRVIKHEADERIAVPNVASVLAKALPAAA